MQCFYGKYKGFCRDNNDPQMLGRIRAECPYPMGTGPDNWTSWAFPCLPPGHFDVPEEGDGVWVEFEAGDAARPLWSGIWYAGRGSTTEAPLQTTHAALKDFDGNDVEQDRQHMAALDPVSNNEHTSGTQPFHDHVSTWYTPHKKVWITKTGQALLFVNDPGKEAMVRLSDGWNRALQFTARGLTQLVSLAVTAASSLWNDLNGSPVDAAHSITFSDLNQDTSGDDPGVWLRIKDYAGAFLKFTSTTGAEDVTLQDFWTQHLTIHSVANAQYIELEDKAGQKLKMDPNAKTVRVDDANGNYILMQDGSVTIFVPSGKIVNIGDTSGQPLATKYFVEQLYNNHLHLSAAPGSPTSKPLIPAPLTPGSDITEKQLSS